MTHSIWMAPWDLAGRDPAELIAFLRGLGLDACNLALRFYSFSMAAPRHFEWLRQAIEASK